MSFRRCARVCLRGLFLLSVISFLTPSVFSYAQPAAQLVDPVEQPEERVLATALGMEKLSPDLRKAVERAGVESRGLANLAASDEVKTVSALIKPGTDVVRFFERYVFSRELSGSQWVSGDISLWNLQKLASLTGVQGIFSTETFQTVEAPGLEDMRKYREHLNTRQLRALREETGPEQVLEYLQQPKALREEPPQSNLSGVRSPDLLSSAASILDIHDVRSAWDQGYRGEGVTVAIVDTGVDFSHPDLQGTHAVVPSGVYQGWPFAYDTLSGYFYALDVKNTVGPDNYWALSGLTQYAHTFPVTDLACDGTTCSSNLAMDLSQGDAGKVAFSWPDRSASGVYYYTVHPDLNLAYAAYLTGLTYPPFYIISPVVIVSDETQPGVYDTVYVDVNYDRMLDTENERMTKGSPVAGTDLTGDKVWDLSAGLLAWISDGQRHPPGVTVVYPQSAAGPVPQAGGLVAFITDLDGHGTNCASQVAGQGQISDPFALGASNPLYAGGAEKGGSGGAVVQSIAPGAKIAAFQNGFYFPFDAWTLAVLGFDGMENTGDEANIVSNSWGDSAIIEDGWDITSRFAHQMMYTIGPNTAFLVATGNGGYGFGTVTSPGGGPIIDVGASTAYGAFRGFENVAPEQFLFGEIQPWSARGPGAAGDIAPDVVAVGAWGLGADPLNIYYGNGQTAYDVFGGTSMATPVAAGSLALVYQAFWQANDRWPTWEEARAFLQAGAADLSYDGFVQGAGNVQAGRSVRLATAGAALTSPQQWQAGGYAGSTYPDFPAILKAGEKDAQVFTITNPTAASAALQVSDWVLRKTHEETFSFSFTPFDETTNKQVPVFLEDMSQRIAMQDADLVRAQVSFPAGSFDMDKDLYADNWWDIAWYDWKDWNGDGNLWVDENLDGQVTEAEIDISAATGLYEYNRFTYGYPQATFMEASLGKMGISQSHDGLFLGLDCVYCGDSNILQVKVTYYQKQDWNWLSVDVPFTVVPAGGSASFTASLAVPEATQPGSYEGTLVVEVDGEKTLVPVTAHVTASGPNLTMGGSGGPEAPFDNQHFLGGYNWAWRPEAGDWRFFYYDMPPEAAEPGNALVVDTRWSGPASDIDTWILGPNLDSFSASRPDLFGPHGMQVVGGSEYTIFNRGKYTWKTNTGTSREVVSAPPREGLGMVALHQVLAGGTQVVEGFSGSLYQLSSSPGEIKIDGLPPPGTPQYPVLTGSYPVTLTSTGEIGDGLQILPYGLSQPINLVDQQVRQDATSNFCDASWGYRLFQGGGLEIRNGGLLDIQVSGEGQVADLDLFLFRDNGDGKWSCQGDKLVAYSINEGASERIKIYFPMDARYWITVRGVHVPEGSMPFDIRIITAQGSNLTLRNLPQGPVEAGEPVNFDLTYRVSFPFSTPTELEGLLFIGMPAAPTLLEVPVHIRPDILLYPRPALFAERLWVTDDPVALELSFQNQGFRDETARVEVTLPEEVEFVPGSAGGPGANPVYDPISRGIAWQGSAASGVPVRIRFAVTAKEGQPPKTVSITAQVDGVTSGQSWTVSSALRVNETITVLPFIRR